MIPIRLELKNFMSYGKDVTPLDLSGIHLACLSGDNGNGKSALLDAITWALWGEARASTDELVRLGADEMRVVFDFELGGSLYRVIRGRSKRNSGNLWEVYVAENTAGENAKVAVEPEIRSPEWRPISGQGIRDTGQIIKRILRMDYKTFINSAYIQQGKADEFTKQTVSDRKRILADILDLSRYDALEQKAKERRNDAEQRVQELDREIGLIEAELANEDVYRTQLAEAQGKRQEVESKVSQTETELRVLQARQSELQAASRRVEEIRRQIGEWQSEVENLVSQRAEQERRVAQAEDIIADRERIVSGRENLQSVRERVAQLDHRLESLRTMEHDKAALDQQILGEKHRLDLEQQSLGRELSELESKVAGAACLEKDATSLRTQIEELDKLSVRRLELEAEVTAQSDQLGELKARHDRLAAETKPELEEKLRLISEPGAKCPLCQTELSHEKHEDLIADYRRRIQELDKEVRELKEGGSEAKKKREVARKEIDEIDARLKNGLEIRRRLAQAEQLLFQIDEYRKQIPDVRAKLTNLEKQLISEDFALEARSKLKDTEAQIAKLEYDAEGHRRLKEDLAGLAEFDALAVSLRHAEESVPVDRSSLAAISQLVLAREKSTSDSRRIMTELSESLAELPNVSSRLSSVSASLQSLREEDRQVTGRIATLEQSLQGCESLHAEVADKRSALQKAKDEKAVYSELVAAFGKKGVQALIIENAIPEIQEEANRLLARMTDNAMQISIETVRDKKTGGTAETLDIKISDDMGTRSYELYSGGEAFRVNFALRIALSKLLARRAGARLQTLIIDEGFGTQDGKGREKLVEAINSIQDDFEKILVITHIDELKDSFPTRIEITKDSSGSQISVN